MSRTRDVDRGGRSISYADQANKASLVPYARRFGPTPSSRTFFSQT